MDTVITILDNGKLLKPQINNEGELEPFFKIKKVEEPGRQNIEESIQDWTKFGFENDDDYKKAIHRFYKENE